MSDEFFRERSEFTLESVRSQLLSEMKPGGHWVGELSASALSTATAISALAFFLADRKTSQIEKTCRELIESGLRWLMSNQNNDGGWGDTRDNYSNISTTMLVIAALHASCKSEAHANAVSKAQRFVDAHGGVDGIRMRYGTDKTFAVPILANCAMAGMVPWSEVSALPFEAACVPQRFYHLLNLPVVSYAIPALVGIGIVKFHFDPPTNPLVRWLRSISVNKSLRLLSKMQPASGGYLEAIPLTSFVCMALIRAGKANHPVVTNGIRFLSETFRRTTDNQGAWPIDTNLATWVTTLSVNALASDDSFEFEPAEKWNECLDWILSCQYKSVHPFTGAAPGGWGWNDLSGAVPDADDTPGALLAIRKFRDRCELSDTRKQQIDLAVESGIIWLLKLQNRDGGWPTFCKGWGRLPFDRSGCDISAHVIRAMNVWKATSVRQAQINRAICKGFNYLGKKQERNGSWLPLWFGNQDQSDDINPFYGTAKVLHAYHECDRFHTKSAQNGLEWIRGNQNDDGGWGGGRSVDWQQCSVLGQSSVEETALCTETLLLDQSSSVSIQAAKRGIGWLQIAARENLIRHCTPIGFYFAKLWYFEKLYPLIFATSALGLSISQQQEAD